MRKRLTGRVLALLLAGWMACSPLAVLADGPDNITISSVEDLLDFSRRCALDAWSQGKTVTLTADLDLKEVEFAPIPTFGGTFLGQGHTISGLRVTAAGSNMGLFRYIQPGALVQDLTVKGTVAPEGSRSAVGGIVGDNAGTLHNCSFHGAVLGESSVGGVAGRNSVSGQLIGCAASGAVTGENATGGIAGRSSGLLLNCENTAGVNLTRTESELDLMAEDAGAALAELATAGDEAYHLLNGCADTGGIVGWTAGVVQGCVNRGDVGYPHVGYNTGGVAGRQSGYMSGCVNHGTIHGRKDVGGVVGQAEPYLLMDPGRDTLDQLKKELDTLDALINRALDDTQRTGDAVSARLSAMGDYTDDARNSSKRLLDQVSDFADNTVDTVNLILADATSALDKMSPALDDLSDAGGRMEELSDRLGQAMEALGSAVDIGDEAMADLRAAVQAVRRSGADLDGALDGVEQALDELTRSLLSDDKPAISRALARLRRAADSMSSAFDDLSAAFGQLRGALDLHFDGLESIPGEIADAVAAVRAAAQRVSSAMGNIGSAMDSVSSALNAMEQAVEDLREDWTDARSTLKGAFDALRAAGDDIDAALAELERALGRSDSLSGFLGDALEGLGDVSGSASEIGRLLGSAFGTISDAVSDLTRDGPRKFTPLGDGARESTDSLYGSLNSLSGELEALNRDLSGGSDLLSDDMRAINRQFNVVFDVLLNALTDLRDDVEAGPETIIQDTSDEDISATREGKVDGCSNTGVVKGDRNVGGIVGTMAVEADLDPEDDISLSFGATFETKAVLQDCVNRGDVTAKKDCAGGLAGRMDLGTALGCQSYGGITSTSGNYVGGAVGWADASVRGCFTKNTLSGGNYVGGVAGWASRMKDCRSIAVIKAGTECLGAVAGSVEADGVLSGNLFVDTGWGGVDGVSYAGRAEPIAFDALAALPDLPQEFTAFTLTLTADGSPVAQLPFHYGDDLSRLTLPDVPEKEGCYGLWPEFDTSGTGSDLTIEAVYTPWVTLISSEECQGKLSLALAEGQFTEDAVLHVTDSAQAPPDSCGEEARVWDISLTGAQLPGEALIPLRLLDPSGGSAIVWRLEDGQWRQVEPGQNGQYLLVTMAGTQGTFCIAPQAALPWPLLGAAAGVAVLLALLALVSKRLKTRRAAKAAAQAAQAQEDTEHAAK